MPYKGQPLTEREIEVLKLFAIEGATSSEAARNLGIGAQTVKNHCTNIRIKLNAKTMPHAVFKSIGFLLGLERPYTKEEANKKRGTRQEARITDKGNRYED